MNESGKLRAKMVKLLLSIMAAVLLAATATACGSSGDSDSSGGPATSSAEVTDIGTNEPGVVKVAAYQYMPYVGVQKEQLVGLEPEILEEALKGLGQKVEFISSDFAGTLAGVQSGRADIAMGGIAWTDERTKSGRFTDSIYFGPPVALVKSGTTLETLADLRDSTVGMLTGASYADGVKSIPGAKPRFYSGPAEALADLRAGRVKAYMTDALVAVYLAKQDASGGLEAAYFTPPTAEEIEETPGLGAFAPFEVSWYLNEKSEKFEQALNEQLAKLRRDGAIEQALKRWGVEDAGVYLTPAPQIAEQRQGVDRSQDWIAPDGSGS